MEIVALLKKLLGAIFVGVIVGLIVWVVGLLLTFIPFAIVSAIGAFLVKAAPWLGLLAGLFELLSGAGQNWWTSRRV